MKEQTFTELEGREGMIVPGVQISGIIWTAFWEGSIILQPKRPQDSTYRRNESSSKRRACYNGHHSTPEATRTAYFRISFFDQLSPQEIADLFQLSSANVYQIISRSRKKVIQEKFASPLTLILRREGTWEL